MDNLSIYRDNVANLFWHFDAFKNKARYFMCPLPFEVKYELFAKKGGKPFQTIRLVKSPICIGALFQAWKQYPELFRISSEGRTGMIFSFNGSPLSGSNNWSAVNIESGEIFSGTGAPSFMDRCQCLNDAVLQSEEILEQYVKQKVDVSNFTLASVSAINTGENNVFAEIFSGSENNKSIVHAVKSVYSDDGPKYYYFGKMDLGPLRGKITVNMGYGEMVECEHKGIQVTGNGLLTNDLLSFVAYDYYLEVVDNPQQLTQYKEYTENLRMILFKDNSVKEFAVDSESQNDRIVQGYNGGVIFGTRAYSADGILLYTCNDWWMSLFNSYSKVFWFPINEEEYFAVCFSILAGGKSFSYTGALAMRAEFMNLKTGEYKWSSTGDFENALDKAGVVRKSDDRIDSVTNTYVNGLQYKFRVVGKAYSGTNISYTIIVDARNKTIEIAV